MLDTWWAIQNMLLYTAVVILSLSPFYIKSIIIWYIENYTKLLIVLLWMYYFIIWIVILLNIFLLIFHHTSCNWALPVGNKVLYIYRSIWDSPCIYECVLCFRWVGDTLNLGAKLFWLTTFLNCRYTLEWHKTACTRSYHSTNWR